MQVKSGQAWPCAFGQWPTIYIYMHEKGIARDNSMGLTSLGSSMIGDDVLPNGE